MRARVGPLSFFFLLLLVSCLSHAAARAQGPASGGGPRPEAAAIIAEVNGQPITRHDLEEALALDEDWLRLERQGRAGGGASLDVLRQRVRDRVLDRLIEDALLVQAARERGIELTPEDEKDIERDFVERARARWGSVEALEEALKERGVSIQRLRRDQRNAAIIRKLLQVEAQKVDLFVRPQEIREYYETHREEYREPGQVVFGHIDVKTAKRSREEARKIAEEILAEIRAGKDFADVARARSEGVHAEQGGEWKAESLRSLRKDIADALGRLAPGEVSEPVEVRDGYMILKLYRLEPESFKPFEAVQEEIAARLQRAKIDERIEELKSRLRAQASIRIKE